MSESRDGESRDSCSYLSCSYPSYTPMTRSIEDSALRTIPTNAGNKRKKTEPKTKHTDIGSIRKQVMEDLYDELYQEIKDEVREGLEQEKAKIVGEIKEQLKDNLIRDIVYGGNRGDWNNDR